MAYLVSRFSQMNKILLMSLDFVFFLAASVLVQTLRFEKMSFDFIQDPLFWGVAFTTLCSLYIFGNYDFSDRETLRILILRLLRALGFSLVITLCLTFIFGQKHMDVLCREFKDHYHLERPHQGLENELIQKPPTKRWKKTKPNVNTIRLSDIRCDERLGGLLKSYRRVAA